MNREYKYVHMYNKERKIEAALAYELKSFNFQEMIKEVRKRYPEVYWINVGQETNKAINLILIKK